MNSEKSLSLLSVFTARSHRLMVRSPPFQGGSTGSNPVGITSRHRFTMPFFCPFHSLALLLLIKLVLRIFMEQHLKQGRERFGLVISISTFVLMICTLSLFGCRSSEPTISGRTTTCRTICIFKREYLSSHICFCSTC